jgi:2-octaprenyl-6-methoxyphenol hydroxylase
MNICIIGDGLTSLSLAKNLINKKINVHIYQKNKIQNLSSSRTIGISQNNLEFFNKKIYKISQKDAWKINKIEIFSEKIKNENLLRFENIEDNLFYMVKNDNLYNLLKKEISKSKFFKKTIIKKNNFYEKFLNDNKFDLIINCELNSPISKKYFSKKIDKDYNNLAYATILNHQKLENNTAIQIFTKFGPIAFLPISNKETSVVCSVENKNFSLKDNDIVDLINKHNPKYKIKKILKLSIFKLTSSTLRNYHSKNILAFGDLLHRIHPLAGQGFNMTIRDIKVLSEIIQNKIDLGLQLDVSIIDDFVNKTKDKNFLFFSIIDLIHEAFSMDKKIKNENFVKILKIFGKNRYLNNYLIKTADRGLKF